MDIVVKKQLGYMAAGIWGSWGFAMLAYLLGIATSPLWIAAIEGTWYAVDAFIIFFIHYYFNIEMRTPEAQFNAILADLAKLIPILKPEEAQLAEALVKKLSA